jgi:hypothetical protein
MRFIANLLPLLQQSLSLARVIIVHTGTEEGPIDTSDIAGKSLPFWRMAGHRSSMTTLTLEHFASVAPTVSFIHSYPGYVHTPLANSVKGVIGVVMRGAISAMMFFGLMAVVPIEESGSRHAFYATSARFPPKERKGREVAGEEADGVEEGVVTVGSDRQVGSGVYSVNEVGETADVRVQELLEGLRRDGVREKVWLHLQETFQLITGTMSIKVSGL